VAQHVHAQVGPCGQESQEVSEERPTVNKVRHWAREEAIALAAAVTAPNDSTALEWLFRASICRDKMIRLKEKEGADDRTTTYESE
jgi:hypothetical protein